MCALTRGSSRREGLRFKFISLWVLIYEENEWLLKTRVATTTCMVLKDFFTPQINCNNMFTTVSNLFNSSYKQSNFWWPLLKPLHGLEEKLWTVWFWRSYSTSVTVQVWSDKGNFYGNHVVLTQWCDLVKIGWCPTDYDTIQWIWWCIPIYGAANYCKLRMHTHSDDMILLCLSLISTSCKRKTGLLLFWVDVLSFSPYGLHCDCLSPPLWAETFGLICDYVVTV